MENHVGTSLTIDNFIGLMVKKEDNWTNFQALCNKIMKSRLIHKKVERRRRRGKQSKYSVHHGAISVADILVQR